MAKTNQQIARETFESFGNEVTKLMFANAGNLPEQDLALIEARHGYRHGWVSINGESFNRDLAFPEIRFPRFPADQGTND